MKYEEPEIGTKKGKGHAGVADLRNATIPSRRHHTNSRQKNICEKRVKKEQPSPESGFFLCVINCWLARGSIGRTTEKIASGQKRRRNRKNLN